MAVHAGHREGELSNTMLGFILFLASEVMFFGGLFAAYFIARADAPEWPPESLLTQAQIDAGVKLEVELPLTLIATIILVASSFTIQYAVMQIKRGNRTGLITWLLISLVMGIVFLAMQLYDYSQLPFNPDDTVYGTTFYTLTGFHGLHVFGGAVFMLIILMRSMGGQFSARSHEGVEACSLYWHFVDIVWIILFSTLYIFGE